ncbi:MAG: methyltransferase domain-containing protein [Sphaerospermopsis sp. SIO1G1]|nr:methyltransferase domain-containing protein [Sphaerospermopsis sp. SIO1G1]
MKPIYHSGQLTQEQLDEFKEVFDLFDADSNGSLTREELVSTMGSLGMSLTDEELEAIFIKADPDLSGTLEFPEFVEWVVNKVNLTSQDDLREIFSLIDLDGNGSISVDELRQLLDSLKINLGEDELTILFEKADRDNNGKIDYNEFLESGEFWGQIKLTLGVTRSFKEILKQYTQLAQNPQTGFGTINPLPYGKENAAKMGYDVSQLPDVVWESSCMCGNSFSLGPINKDETVIDLGCGAGADLCVAASLVGETGKVIGVDMTAAMVKKARENAELCNLNNIEVIKAPFDMAQHEDIPESVADVVISNGTFNLSPRKKCAFVQAYNCLKPGGRFYLVDVVREGNSESETEEGSWCDCVAGAIPVFKVLEVMESVGFVECEHLGYTGYRTSDYTVAATFRAKKAE